MAIITCPECKKEVSDHANTCPHCGKPPYPISKILNAHRHLDLLRDAYDEYLNSEPFKIATKRDPASRKLIYYVSEVKNDSDVLSLACGDIIQNLSSALDHLAFSLFRSNGGGDLNGRHIYFPIGDSVEDYEKRKIKRLFGVASQNISKIDSVRPYKGGNDLLWALKELNNTDKHRLIVTVGSKLKSVDIAPTFKNDFTFDTANFDFSKFQLRLTPADDLFPLKSGDELFIDRPDATENSDLEFEFDIVINEKGIVEGEPVLTYMKALIEEVQRVCRSIK